MDGRIQTRKQTPKTELDGLRLLAIGRIPRCGDCPRFSKMVEAHRDGGPDGAELPAVPAFCHHAVCSPVAERIWADRSLPRTA